MKEQQSRRNFVQKIGATVGLIAGVTTSSSQSALAVERAVGGAELECQKAGNCLEIGEWDGAVGWQWGAKDRCDPTDPRCGLDGKLMDAPPQGEPVPELTNTITHQIELSVSIGRTDSGVLRLGLYGQDCPLSVQQMVDFVSSGIVTTSRLMFEDGYGISSAPVSLENGGLVTGIVPRERIDFGIPSQAAAYAKSKGKAKAGDNFQAQPRPKNNELANEPYVRKHTVAGLVSIPSKGLGYGGSGLESEDEAFASTFEITGGSVPAMDNREGRRVIGQVLDEESMAFLARLVSLPTRKGIKGVIPGQNSGPPLVKVSVRDITVKTL